jgi:hypothetical protein
LQLGSTAVALLQVLLDPENLQLRQFMIEIPHEQGLESVICHSSL